MTHSGKNNSSHGHNSDGDGITHINIHPKGKTPLGRLLTFFRNIPFIHPNYGPFYSMEGFKHYVQTGYKHDKLRYVYGYNAKKLGKTYPSEMGNISNVDYELEIMLAHYEKIKQNIRLLQMVVDSDLPFDSYYTFGPNNILVDTRESDWLIYSMTEIRKALKQGVDPEPLVRLIAKYSAK